MPSLDGYLLPSQIMAAVRDQIKSYNLQELLKKKDAEYKCIYADWFPLRLPDICLDDVPDHIYHLKGPTKVVQKQGYAAPKKYLKPWEKLLKSQLDAGHMHPSLSEYSSPSFCVLKFHEGVLDLTLEPHWVNDFHELNANTVCNNFPLPLADDIFGACGVGKIFAKMDMTNPFPSNLGSPWWHPSHCCSHTLGPIWVDCHANGWL